MKNLSLILVLFLCICKVQSQDVQNVFTTTDSPDMNNLIYNIVSEDSLLYVLTDHDLVTLTYDINTQETEIQETMTFGSNVFPYKMYLTEDWIYFSVHGNHRSIRRINRNDPNQELQIVKENILFPSGLVATETAVYYSDYEALYKIDLDNPTADPVLLIEDYRLGAESFKLTLLDSDIYATGRDVLYKINTTNDNVEIFDVPGLEAYTSTVPIGTDKLLGNLYGELFLIDLVDNSFSILGAIDCQLSPSCFGADLAIIDNNLYLSESESPDVITYTLPSEVYEDFDGDKYGNLESKRSIVNNDFVTGFIFDSRDCDDTNPNVNPDQVEVAYNGLDDDCDASTLDDDFDGDGFNLDVDCDDNNPNVNPMAVEIPNNEIDEDCDGMDLISTSSDEIESFAIDIYPNPASKNIFINLENQFEFQSNLYSVEGKLLKSKNNASQMEVSTIPNGIYFLEIVNINTDQKVLRKVLVSN